MLIPLFAACGQGSAPGAATDTLSAAGPAASPDPDIQQLLSQYQEMTFDTLDVTSPGYDAEANALRGPFAGKWLDTPLVMQIASDAREIGSAGNAHSGYHACVRFKAGDHLTGLITRVPGEYESSRVVLQFYDQTTGRFSEPELLADRWGDAGDALTISTWIVRKPDGSVQLRQLYDESHSDVEHQDTVTFSERFHRHYFLDQHGVKFDTLAQGAKASQDFYRHRLGANYLVPDSVYLEKDSLTHSHE
ncbi:hypothetical protein ACWKWU_19005 [Chitinophaga lutea]